MRGRTCTSALARILLVMTERDEIAFTLDTTGSRQGVMPPARAVTTQWGPPAGIGYGIPANVAETLYLRERRAGEPRGTVACGRIVSPSRAVEGSVALRPLAGRLALAPSPRPRHRKPLCGVSGGSAHDAQMAAWLMDRGEPFVRPAGHKGIHSLRSRTLPCDRDRSPLRKEHNGSL